MFIPIGVVPKRLSAPDKSQLFFHINRLTNIHRLCISSSVTPDILAIAHGKDHLGFSCCYKIISHSWFIHSFIKLFHAFICYCLECLALQIRWHTPYGSLQPIESPPVLFFTLTLDFVLALPLFKRDHNALISVTCKFTKRITLIKGADTWSAE